MAYFVTGATGFIGRFLVRELLETRPGHVFVLVRPASLHRADQLVEQWGHPDRVTVVPGDLLEAGLGVDAAWVADHQGTIDHFFHLAGSYDMTAGDEEAEALNVGGTRGALELAADLDAGVVHHLSSIAVSGDFAGFWDETMFDVGQQLPSAYHRTKFASEKVVREESAVPWRIYRPAMVLGHSETGEADKADGPYYLFPMLKLLRDRLPTWTPLVGLDLGDTNVVPVDFVARALVWLAHVPGCDGQAFHLVDPEPMRTIDLVNTFADAAGGPTFATPVDRSLTGVVPTGLLPKGLRPATLVRNVLRSSAAQLALRETVGRLGMPPQVVEHLTLPTRYGARATQRALEGSGITVPPLASYAEEVWSYWEEQLDDALTRHPGTVAALRGRIVVITGASSGIGRATALKVAQAGGVPVLVARGKDGLEAVRAVIESRGGTAHVFPCDLSDLVAIDNLTTRLGEELGRIDYLVNNAGRSIRRSVQLSHDRFHDFERTMQLNYFGAVRLVMGLLPRMRQQRGGHVVNISSIGVQTNPPRFSAYVASKAALDAWSNVVSSEVVGDGVSFTNIHMPLVRTPMIAPTGIYDKFPTISAAQAADLVLRALVEKPFEINTRLGTVGALAHTLAPKGMFRVLHLAYRVFPDSAAARAGAAARVQVTEEVEVAVPSETGDPGAGAEPGADGEVVDSQPVPPRTTAHRSEPAEPAEPGVHRRQQQLVMARLTRGVHW